MENQDELFPHLAPEAKQAPPISKSEPWSLPRARKAWDNFLLTGEFQKAGLAVYWLFEQVRILRASNIYLKRKIKKLEALK